MAKKPDYRLKARKKNGGEGVDLGAGWANGDGSISIALNPGVVIDWRFSEEFYINLFPPFDKTPT